jgi:hypothetical protein
MKKYWIALSFVMGCILTTNAQYKVAVGVRFFDGPALTGKFSVGGNRAVEALLSGFGRGLKGTAMYQWHATAFGTNQWRWYYGVGGHLGASPNRRWIDGHNVPDPDFHLGADGILGIEHTFKEIPLNISADWKPEFNLINHTGLVLPIFGASARLAF